MINKHLQDWITYHEVKRAVVSEIHKKKAKNKCYDNMQIFMPFIADDVQDTLRYKINTYLNALYAGLNQQTNESGV